MKLLSDLIRPAPILDIADYDDYWAVRAHQLSSSERIRFIDARVSSWSRHVRRGDSLVEIGCGTGELLEKIRQQLTDHAQGLEISAKAVEACRMKGLTVVEGDIGAPADPLQGATFDWVVASEVIEHIVDAEGVVSRLLAHARKGLIVTIPNYGFYKHRMRLLLGRFPVTYQLHPREHVRSWTHVDFLEWAGHYGWHLICAEGLVGTSALQVFRRKPALFARCVSYVFAPLTDQACAGESPTPSMPSEETS